MHMNKLSIRGSPFVGVFIKATDEFALVPTGLTPKDKKIIEQTFEVNIVETRIANTSIIGSLCIANKKKVVLPSIAEPDEIDELERQGIKTAVIDSVEALGNHVTLNDTSGICGNALREQTLKSIEHELGIEIKRLTVANSDLVGSATVVTNKGFVCHPKTLEEEFKTLEKTLAIKGNVSSANYGDLFIGNSVAANSFGCLVGQNTTGYEMMAIDEALA